MFSRQGASLTHASRPSHPPRPSLSLVRGPPVSRPSVSGGGQTWRWGFGWRFALLERRAEGVTSPPALRAAPQVWWASCCGACRRCDKPPAPSALPPRVGRPCEDLGVEVCIERPHEPHRKSRSSRAQNANVQEATESPPVLGGSAKRGGLVTPSAKPPTRSPPKRGAARSAGGLSHALQNRRDKQNPFLLGGMASVRARGSGALPS